MIEIDNPTENENTNSIGISYDARQHNAKVLINLKVLLFKCHHEDNYIAWYKTLYNIYWSCKPYSKPNDNVLIKEKLENLKNWLKYNQANVDITLLFEELSELVLEKYKDQFMQVTKHEDTEFNPMDLMGQ